MPTSSFTKDFVLNKETKEKIEKTKDEPGKVVRPNDRINEGREALKRFSPSENKKEKNNMRKTVQVTKGFTIQIAPNGNVCVSLDIEETLKTIGQEIGLYSGCEDVRDTRVVVGGLPEMPALEVQENISCHGSPCWETSHIFTTNKEQIEQYMAFRKLLKYAKEL